MDRLVGLEVFLAVADGRSFTAAAHRLGLPRSTVTAAVQQLERRLGVRLLHRTTRRVAPTPEGVAYARDARRLLDDLAALDGSVGRAAEHPRGRLRVDVPSAAARHLLAPALPAFLDAFPELEVWLGSSDRPVDLLAEGVDCVIRGGDVHDPSLVGRKLVTYPVITAAAPSYLARRGVPERVEDLVRHEVVAFFSPRSGRAFEPEFAVDGELRAVPLRRRIACNDADAWVAAAVAGAGLLQVPLTRAVRGLFDAGQLVRVLPDVDAGELPIHVLWPRQRLAPRVRVFVDWVTRLYAAER